MIHHFSKPFITTYIGRIISVFWLIKSLKFHSATFLLIISCCQKWFNVFGIQTQINMLHGIKTLGWNWTCYNFFRTMPTAKKILLSFKESISHYQPWNVLAISIWKSWPTIISNKNIIQKTKSCQSEFAKCSLVTLVCKIIV